MNNQMQRLKNKIAIVTGSNRGLGQGIALELSREGATVICADLHGADETVQFIEDESPGCAESVLVDITDSSSVRELVDSVVARHGRLDIMVNNAGIYSYRPLSEVSDDEFQQLMDVNVNGTFYCSREAARVMKQQHFGRIINTASQLGKLARPNEGAYAASKAAVILLTQALALELGKYNITANAICPGTMLTQMTEKAISGAAETEGLSAEQKMKDYIDTSIPIGRFGTAADMGKMVTWLASDESSFTTGSALNLTGGEQVFF